MAPQLPAQLPTLQAAVLEAEQLLQYASAKGIELPPNVIDTLVDAKDLIGRDGGDPATFARQKQFWSAFSQLSVATRPASVASLRYAAVVSLSPWSRAWGRLTGKPAAALEVGDMAVRQARMWALLGLVLVALFQASYELGNTTVVDYQGAREKYEQNARGVSQRHEALDALDTGKAAAESVRLKAEVAQLNAENRHLEERASRKILLMKNMLFWIDWPPGMQPLELARRVLSALEGLLVILRDFVLPMGWGFLGAALYVSRSLAEDIRTMAYAPDRAVLHRSRYYMGMVAGFIAAKFSSVLSGGEAVVQPFALALLVGYSVEVLFTLLDKLIGTFTTK